MTNSRRAQFFLYGIIAILGLLFLSYLFYRGGGPRQESVAANSDTPPDLILGNFELIEGTSYYVAEIFNDRPSSYLAYESSRWSSIGAGGQTRNLVFLDGETLASAKLYDHNNSFILSIVPFPQRTDTQEHSTDQGLIPVQWFVYYVVHQDSNDDGLLNENDQGVLALSDFSGLGYREVLSGILNLYELTMPQNGRLLVIHKTTDGRYASIIDMPARELIHTEPLPDLGPGVE